MRLPLPQFLTPRRTLACAGCKSALGLTAKQLTEVSKGLETAVDFSTKGQPADKVIKKIGGKLAFPVDLAERAEAELAVEDARVALLAASRLPALRDDPSPIAAPKFACLPYAAQFLLARRPEVGLISRLKPPTFCERGCRCKQGLGWR